LARLIQQDRLRILLAPQQLRSVVVQGKRLIEGSGRQVAVAHAGGHWQASVDALRALLQQPQVASARLPMEISLSGRWSQMVLAPWSDALLSEPAAGHFLQTQLSALYGDNARGWSIASDDAPYGQTRAVCGIDSTLLQALKDTAAEYGHTCRVIEPLLATALRPLDAAARALALIEPGRITMAALDGKRITAVQSQPAGEAWPLALPQAWQRWTLRSPELAIIEQVAVVDLSMQAPGAEPLPARFHLIASPFGTDAAASATIVPFPSPSEAAA
jgi:hypothetical protein